MSETGFPLEPLVLRGAELDQRYVVHPQRRYHPERTDEGGERVRVSVPHCGKSLQGAPALPRLLDQLAAGPPQLGRDLAARLTPAGFESMVKYFVLLPEPHAEVLRGGLCAPVATPAGAPLASHQLDELTPGDVVLAHAPLVTTAPGAVSVARGGRFIRASLASTLRHPLGERGAPGWLVDLDFATRLDASALRLFDAGDVCHDPLTDNAAALGQRAGYLCRQIVRHGGRPVLLGGDHTLAYHSIGALAERYPRLGVLQFDAHPDLYAIGADCDRTINHANVFHWVRQMPHVSAIWQIGLRDAYHQPLERLAPRRDPKLHTLPAMEVALRGYGRLLDHLDASIPWFVSFDVDALERTDVPETATPVLGGLAYYPLLACFEQLFSRLDIIGLEFVELGDASQGAHGPAAIAARLLTRYLFNLRGAAPLEDNVFAPAEE